MMPVRGSQKEAFVTRTQSLFFYTAMREKSTQVHIHRKWGILANFSKHLLAAWGMVKGNYASMIIWRGGNHYQ